MTSARRPVRVRAGSLAIAVVALAVPALMLGPALPASASASTETLLVSQSFRGSSLPAGTPFVKLDGACLTADPKTNDVPIPGCQNPALDPNGSGVLRLTPAVLGAKGGILYNSTLPTADGLDVHFTQYQYGGSGADGIGFVIATAPPMPNTLGVAGGGLGYSNLQGGYLGIGFDAFGNFLNPGASGTGCVQPAWVPNNPPWNSGNAVSVRGPGTPGAGNGKGYCILTSNYDPTYGLGHALPGALRGASRATAARRVHIVVDAQALTYSVSIDFTGTGNSYTPIITSAPLPKPIPPRITFGFSASTGALTDVHAISDLDVSTFNRRAGYWLTATDGGVFAFATKYWGSATGAVHPAIVGITATPGSGYWLADAAGNVYSYGDAASHGSLPALRITPSRPIVGIAATPTGKGYWLVGADGGVFGFGDAVYAGSLPALGIAPSRPIVGIAATPTGKGYWLAGADGAVVGFGDGGNFGSLPSIHVVPNAPVVGIAASPTGFGYWLVGADGGVFNFGDAAFYGSLGNTVLAGPVVGIARG